MKKLGIFSGSFDPIHDGHISFATEAYQQLSLDSVVFMPEAFPRNKPHVTPVSERITELEIALASTPFSVLGTRTGQFTVDKTIAELITLYPGTDFTFLFGSDVALNMPLWPNIKRLTTAFDFAIGMRRGDDAKAIQNRLDSLNARYILISTPHNHLSSRSIRGDINQQ